MPFRTRARSWSSASRVWPERTSTLHTTSGRSTCVTRRGESNGSASGGVDPHDGDSPEARVGADRRRRAHSHAPAAPAQGPGDRGARLPTSVESNAVFERDGAEAHSYL